MSRIGEYQKQQEYIQKAKDTEKKYGIPDNLIVGLLKTESNFNPKAVSKAGAIGIAQFMPQTAKEYGIDPLNTDQAIDAAGKYLSKSYKQLGNWDDAILSYNAGVGKVKEYKAGKPITLKEHKEYVGKVYNNAGISTYDTMVAPYIKSENINLHNSNLISNIVPQGEYSVPDTYIEPKEENKVEEAKQEVVDPQAEFLKKLQEYYTNSTVQQQEQIPQEEQQPLQGTDVLGMFNDVSQFVDNPSIMQEGGDYQDAMRGMMKSKIGIGNAFNNPAIKRMSQALPKIGITPEGIGTHYMASMGNYAVPLLQDKGDKNLTYNQNPPPSSEDIYFNNPKDAEYFAEHYKEVAPMSTIYKELNTFQEGGQKIAPQLPIKNIIYGVETTTPKQGLPPSKGLIRVDYVNGQSDYLNPSGLDTLRSMNNYRIYMEELSKKQNPQNYNLLTKAQEGGIIQDNKGYWNSKNWGQPVKISSNNITMENVKEPLWAISDTGELRLLQPNKNYTFKGATSVTEYPLLTEEERIFLNGMKKYKNT